MIQLIEPFGYNISGNSIGSIWIDLLKVVLDKGDITYDEERKRKSLQNVRLRISGKKLYQKDIILEKYADKKNIDAIVYLTFEGKEMYDFDVVPSFSPGARSYYARIKEGRMLEYVIKRLTKIPESKKAVISFINWDDYKVVLDTPYDDYLPCILTIQFRIFKETKSFYYMNVNFSARSLDIFQKGNGNILAISMLAREVAVSLSNHLGKKVKINCIDGFISDIHIYGECIDEATKLINKIYS